MKKIKYEKPISLDAGHVAAIQGLKCETYGSSADEGCVDGFDPNTQPYCGPTGAAASGNCEAGDHAVKGCALGDSPGWGCYSGTTPN